MWLLGNPTPEQDIAEAHAKRAEGFGFFKLKIGTKPVETEIAATLALRDALGAETPLCADANCGLSFDDASRVTAASAGPISCSSSSRSLMTTSPASPG